MHALTPFVLVLAAASTLASPGRPSCGPPKIPPHGSVEGGARSSYDLGGYVQYACDRGYQIQRSNVAVCIYKDGGPAWNNPPPQCTRKIFSCWRLLCLILTRMHVLSSLSLFSHWLWCTWESCKRASDCFWRHHFWFHCTVYLQQGVCPHWCKVSDMPRGQAVVSSSTNLQMYVMIFCLCWNLFYMHTILFFLVS